MYIILVICGWVPIAGVKLDFFFFCWYFLWHILFFSPPFSFFVQYILLRYRPSTVVASDGKTDSCTVDIILGYDAEASLGREINKISWN